MSYEEIECPYCEHAYDLNHDDGAFYNNGEREATECPNCEKKFLVYSSMSWDFDAEKADCLNDGNHQWVKEHSKPNIETYPDLAARERCETCDKKRTVDLSTHQ